jgi:hypothetical protein
MFSRPVDGVTKTRIFVSLACAAGDDGPAAGGAGAKAAVAALPRRQLTVYANNVTLPKRGGATAMILPVPVLPTTRAAGRADCGIVVHAMPDASANFFEVLAAKATDQDPDFPVEAILLSKHASLLVHRAGAYQYTIVPSVADFPRLQRDVYNLPQGSELLAVLAEHYFEGFAFLVCIIDASAVFRPFAYEHDTLPSGELFVPTRHYHPHAAEAPLSGAIASASSAASAPTKTRSSRVLRSQGGTAFAPPADVLAPEPDEEDGADWDHIIYSAGVVPTFTSGRTTNERIPRGGPPLSLDAAMVAAGVVGLPFRLPDVVGIRLRMRKIRGTYVSCDLVFRPLPPDWVDPVDVEDDDEDYDPDEDEDDDDEDDEDEDDEYGDEEEGDDEDVAMEED